MDGHRSSASAISRATRSVSCTPRAAHSCGYMLMAVKPGIVLISLKTTPPNYSQKKSTRARPKPSTARKTASAASRIFSVAPPGRTGSVTVCEAAL